MVEPSWEDMTWLLHFQRPVIPGPKRLAMPLNREEYQDDTEVLECPRDNVLVSGLF